MTEPLPTQATTTAPEPAIRTQGLTTTHRTGKVVVPALVAANDRRDGHSISQAVDVPLTIQVQIETKYATRTFSHNFTVQNK